VTVPPLQGSRPFESEFWRSNRVFSSEGDPDALKRKNKQADKKAREVKTKQNHSLSSTTTTSTLHDELNMSNIPQDTPTTPASPIEVLDTPSPPIESQLEREVRLAAAHEATQEVARHQVLDELLATQARLNEEAAAKREEVALKEAKKGKAREKELPELDAERFGQEMRSNGTALQQEDWRSFTHEVRRWSVAPWVFLTNFSLSLVPPVKDGRCLARLARRSSARRASIPIALARGWRNIVVGASSRCGTLTKLVSIGWVWRRQHWARPVLAKLSRPRHDLRTPRSDRVALAGQCRALSRRSRGPLQVR
jgi:hypothetical protein